MNSVIRRRLAKSKPAPARDPASALLIVPSGGLPSLGLKELWQHRELLYFLAWRDIKVRYKQTALGVLWAMIQPLFIMIVFSIFFGHLAGVPSDGIAYPLFVYTALVPWTLFAHSLTESSNSLVANERLITRVYFPRLVIPISTTLAGLVDFAISLIALVALAVYYGVRPGLEVLTLPLFVLLGVMTALGAGLWLSALNVQYRDVRYALAFLAQLWLFATPVAYPSSIVPERWRLIYGLNPMAGVVEGFRWALLGKSEGPGVLLVVSTLVVIMIFVSGLFYFRRMEDRFADVI